MVAALTTGRPAYVAVDAEVREIAGKAARLQDQLLQLGQTDADAYDAVVRARRMPRETDTERDQRDVALAAAMREAAETPMVTAERAVDVLALAGRIGAIGNRNAASDAGVAALLAASGARGAALNVRINLPYLGDEQHRDELARRLGTLDERVNALLAEALRTVDERLT
jgi:formiminotetrahydrofolate cyclodeaminase